MDEIAMWLGYGAMVVGGFCIVAAFLFGASLVSTIIVRDIWRDLVGTYNMTQLRAEMRRLEAEGKVRRKEVDHG